MIVSAHVGLKEGRLVDATLGLIPLSALARSLLPKVFPRNNNL